MYTLEHTLKHTLNTLEHILDHNGSLVHGLWKLRSKPFLKNKLLINSQKGLFHYLKKKKKKSGYFHQITTFGGLFL